MTSVTCLKTIFVCTCFLGSVVGHYVGLVGVYWRAMLSANWRYIKVCSELRDEIFSTVCLRDDKNKENKVQIENNWSYSLAMPPYLMLPAEVFFDAELLTASLWLPISGTGCSEGLQGEEDANIWSCGINLFPS